ncbi:gamma-glutamyltransferase [Abyssalbus ytuae]|uniref:Glutathione hydrolase proenzyme n=1 Tax=Abyssalbus ytuae TaxID=2926907 RepID=A0A9E7CU24_9FLAO|nr:gamma-glutamyltransferase [Abyssalbus ytuae]UOB17427.1 gamma-glutamyltransferase [Abyssalbus ytuae]
MRKLIFILFLLTVSCKTKMAAPSGMVTHKAMVVSARSEASKIGANILARGGNAFDAMIATELALAVAYPYAGNISGGGFMVYRLNDGKTGALDYREKAPLAATRNMYLDASGKVIPGKSWFGATATAVPGTIAGIFEVHKKFGSLPFSTLIQPAIDLAQKGVIITHKQDSTIKYYKKQILKVSGSNNFFAKDIKEKDTVRFTQLANTLERIKNNGRDEFYNGTTARLLVNFVQSKGGYITMEDLQKYEAKWRDPVEFRYKKLKIISMSPPSSGGITLGQIMKMIEPYNISKYGHNQAKTIQLITEAERRAYADRNYFLGDPDFVEIPTAKLLDKSYLKSRMSGFTFKQPTLSSSVSHGNIEIVESDETTHYSIVDPFGNAVSVTTTVNGAYGSKLYCDELGIFLNNEMDDFSSKPGTPNMFGLIGAKANRIEPEKRMLSSMTPTIVEKNGKLWMVVGTPGGSTIITSVLQTILNVYEFKMSMQEAVNAPRFHHQWLPDDIKMEPGRFSKKVKEELTKLGYKINEHNSRIIGKVDAILVRRNGSLEAGADKRGDDTAAGF